MKRVMEAEYLQDYKILITFNNGVKKIVDLKLDLWGVMFEPLKDKNLFKQFRIDKDICTIVWSNGADFSPDSLYEIGKSITRTTSKKRKLTSHDVSK